MKASTLLACLGMPACFAAGYLLSPGKPDESSTTASKRRVWESPLADSGNRVAAVLQEINASTDPLEGRLRLLSFIEGASSRELERLFSSARISDELSTRNAAAQQWAEVDPEGFLKHLQTLRPDEMEELREVTAILFRTWAHRDPGKALEAARAAGIAGGFAGARSAVVSGVLEDDPEKGFAILASEKNMYLEQAFKKAVWEKDPARFVKASAQAMDSQVRYGWMDPFGGYGGSGLADACREALTAWADVDFPAALEWAKSMKSDVRASVMPDLLGKLAEKDPGQARAIFESLAPSREREAAGQTIVAQWAKTDPKAALEWIEATMTGGKPLAYDAWIRAVAASGMENAARLLETLPDGNGRDNATRTLAREWADKDVAAAIKWINGLEDDAGRREAYSQVSSQWVQKDPAGYKDFIATAPRADLPEHYPYYLYGRSKEEEENNLKWAAALPEDRRDSIFLNLFSQSAWNRNPRELADLLNTVTSTDLQASAGAQAVRDLLRNDSSKAEEFIGALPPGLLKPDQREQLRGYVEGLDFLSGTEKQTLLKKLM